MATIFTEAFTNSNGTAWNTHNADWTVSNTGAGSAATVEGNAGRQRVQVGAYGGSVRAYHSDSAHTDIRLFFTFTVDAGNDEMYPQVRVRADSGYGATSCYMLNIQPSWGNVRLNRVVAAAETTIDGPESFSFSGGTTYYGIFEADSTTISCWLSTGTFDDPDVDPPLLTAVDTNVVSGGVALVNFGGNTATDQDATWDALDADDMVAPSAPSQPPWPRSRFHRHLLVR